MMHNVDSLPEFREYLVDEKLVPEKNAGYFAFWVSKFLDCSKHKNHQADLEEKNQVFLQKKRHWLLLTNPSLFFYFSPLFEFGVVKEKGKNMIFWNTASDYS